MKQRAKRNGRQFSLVAEDLLPLPEICPLLGITLDYSKNRGKGFLPDSPSIDRIDNSKGYTADNIWVISNKANSIKRDATYEDLRTLAACLHGELMRRKRFALRKAIAGLPLFSNGERL